jgi:hypothetical protein
MNGLLEPMGRIARKVAQKSLGDAALQKISENRFSWMIDLEVHEHDPVNDEKCRFRHVQVARLDKLDDMVYAALVSNREEKIHQHIFQATCIRNAVKRAYHYMLLVMVKKSAKALYGGQREGLG